MPIVIVRDYIVRNAVALERDILEVSKTIVEESEFYDLLIATEELYLRGKLFEVRRSLDEEGWRTPSEVASSARHNNIYSLSSLTVLS